MSSKFTEIAKRHLGPPVNIEAIIRAMGIELDKKAELDDEIAGQLAKLPEGKFKISINKADTYYRQRFTMAHELGHYLLHAHLIGDGVDDSKAYRSVPTGQFYNEAITRHEETQANQFASRLLLPKSVVTTLAYPGATIKEISVKLQASIPATQIRLAALGYNVVNDVVVGIPTTDEV